MLVDINLKDVLTIHYQWLTNSDKCHGLLTKLIFHHLLTMSKIHRKDILRLVMQYHCGVVTIWLHINDSLWSYPYKLVGIRYDQYLVVHYLNFSANLNVLVRISKRNGFICIKYAFDCIKLVLSYSSFYLRVSNYYE